MFGSHFAEAIRTVGAQWLLVNRKFGVIESMYYFAPATVVLQIAPWCILGRVTSAGSMDVARSIGICLSFPLRGDV